MKHTHQSAKMGIIRANAFLLAGLVALASGARSAGAAEVLTDAEHTYTGLPDTKEFEAAKDRRTLFGQPLDPRSRYGLAWFPETLRVPEMDVEYSEMRLDYFHSEGDSGRSDEVKAEFEHSFGALTLEVELPYDWVTQPGGGTIDGLNRFEVGVRHPLFQYVSASGAIDYTCVGAFELALPAKKAFGEDTEISPRIYQLLRIGDHASVQSSVAYSVLAGPEDGGAESIEYGLSLGYSLSRDDLDIPGVIMFTPILEVAGENVLSGDEHGANPVFGVVGLRVYTEPVWFFQPRIGVGYEFPLNHHARDEMEWGLLFSFNFEM